MAIVLGNRAKMSTSTTGTGTITLGSALSGYQTFAQAGITNGQTVRYTIEDGTNFEIGSGVFTSSGTTLTRSVTESSNSDNAITLSGSAEVFITASAADIFVNDGATSLTTTGVGTFASLDISGDVDVDGTLEADAITVNGTALATVIAGTTVTNATNSAHVLVTDNESTNEENLIAFVEGATSSTGNVGLEMDGNFTYNPSTGTVSATVFKGNIDAVDGDFDGTLEADAITIGGTAVGSIFSPIAGGTGIVTTGALDAGSITSGFGAINNGASNITTTGVGTFASLDISGDIDVDGTTNLDGFTSVGNGTITGDLVIQDTGFPRITLQDLDGTNTRSFIDHSGSDLIFTAQNNTAHGRITFNRYNNSSTVTSGYFDAAGKLFINGDLDVDGTTNLDAVDIDGAVQLDATLTVGANDQGYDVILYGDTASANVTWDTSADDLIFNGAAGLVVPKDKITIGSTAVTTTAAEINQLDAITRGSIVYGNSSGATARLAAGDADTVLTSDGTDISWAAAGGGGTEIPSGTLMLFNQTAAPTGFTKSTTHNDKAIRITSGTVGTGGSVAFETAFASQAVSVAATTIAISTMAAHKHVAGFAGVNSSASFGVSSAPNGNINSQSGQTTGNHANTSTVGGGGSHTHTGTAIDLDVLYVDVIIASKD